MAEADLLGTAEYIEAMALWQQGRFWEVHEALEPLWHRLSGQERELTHGVILLAAALHKARTSPSGGWRNFQKALAHLERLPPVYSRIQVAELIEESRRGLQDPAYKPRFPRR